MLIAPEMNGWTAPIILMWPMWWMKRSPFCGLNAQSNTARCSSVTPGAPSIVPCRSTYAVIALVSVSV